MNRKDFMQLLSAGFAEPKLLAKATSDYYTRCKQRLLSKVDAIAKAVQSEDSSNVGNGYVSLQVNTDVGLSGCFINVDDITEQIVQAIKTNPNESDYGDISLTLYDHYSDSPVTLTSGEIFSQLGEASDSLTIAIEAFASLSSEVASTATDFTNRIGILIPNMTEQTMQVCNDVYQLISSSEGNISSTYELINDYFGIKQNMDRVESDPFTLGDPAIEQYTGVNPTVSLLSGLDWLGPVKWWVAIQKFQVDAIVGIGKWVWKGLASVGKWFVKSVDQTFVNPVDVETTGDTYEFFDNYSSILYDFYDIWDEGNLPWELLDINLKKFFIDSTGAPRPIWFNFKTITYQMTYQKMPDTPAGINNNYVLAVNRYLKPTNINKFRDLLTTAGVSLSPESYGNIDWVKFCRELQNTDLSCSKDASEKEVAASLVLTNLIDRWLTGIFDITNPYHSFDDRFGVNESRCQALMDEYMNTEIQGNMYLPTDILTWIKRYDNMEYSTILYGQMGIWYSDYETTFNSDYTQVLSYGSQTQLLERICNNQVTNKDFIQLLCNFAVRSEGDNAHAHIHTPFNTGNGWNVVWPRNVMNGGTNGTELGFSMLLTQMFLSEDLELVVNYRSDGYERRFHPNFNEKYDGVYLAYSRGALDINKNATVKTDQQNIDAARNWMITAIVITAAIVASIYIGVTVTSLLKTCRLRQAQIDSNMFKIGEMISNGASQDEVNALYATTSKLMKKNKLLGKLFGTTGYSLNAIINQGVSEISLPTTKVSANLDPVIDLIQ